MNDLDKINTLFKLITESPDFIQVQTKDGKKVYDYTDSGAYPCYIYEDGLFVLSLISDTGHLDLDDSIYTSIEESRDVGIKHNFGTPSHNMMRGHNACRIWPKQKVFSMWIMYHPKYIDSVIETIKAAGYDPKQFTYDTKDHQFNDGKGLTYDEFKNRKMTIDDMYKQAEFEKEREKNDMLMARVQAGEIKPKKDLYKDFYKREGD